MKPLLVVNPRSGGGRAGRTFDQMRGPIERALGEVDVSFTERPRHASEIARRGAEEGREVVIAVGGDGSISEVVNGLMQAREAGARVPRLGIVGQGTGGDFRRTLGIEHRLDKYCEAIAAGRTRAIDVGRFSYRADDGSDASAYFVNILSVGIGGLVDRYVADTTKSLGGTVAYFFASLRGLVDSEIGTLSCRVGRKGDVHEERLRTRSVAICNGRYFGSGMHVAPMAKPDDGVFEVVDLGDAPRLRFATVSSRMYTGTHIDHPDVRHFSCDSISIELVEENLGDRFLLDVDGEPLGRLPISIELVPAAIEVLVPPT